MSKINIILDNSGSMTVFMSEYISIIKDIVKIHQVNIYSSNNDMTIVEYVVNNSKQFANIEQKLSKTIGMFDITDAIKKIKDKNIQTFLLTDDTFAITKFSSHIKLILPDTLVKHVSPLKVVNNQNTDCGKFISISMFKKNFLNELRKSKLERIIK